ncbi:MAG: T9SS type A sorting domain-containing protein [Balneolaceae bacterium]
MSASLVGFQEGEQPDFPEPPVNDSVELFQNYPNPFTQTTSIEFSLPEDAEIEISLHDILGRKVDILHSGYTPAGLHTLEYDPGDLASGIYFYRLAYPGGVTSRRMTRLR